MTHTIKLYNMKIHKAYRFRLYPTLEQESLFRRIAGCCRFVYNLALEQRRVFGRPGRTIRYVAQASELSALKAEIGWLVEAPHHCLQQTLRDLDGAFAKFFGGVTGYPKPKRKYENDSFRFPDPKQFRVGSRSIFLPKIGEVIMRAHRPFQGRPRTVTVVREGDHWYANILVKVRHRILARETVSETAFDIGATKEDEVYRNAVVEADGTVHTMPRVTNVDMQRKKRLQKSLARKTRGSRNRTKARLALARFEAKLARRRRNAQHKISKSLVKQHTHIAYEDLNLRNMTRSAKGSIKHHGTNVRQKAGLNRTMIDVAPGILRRQIEYKARWAGVVTTAVSPYRSSQICSSCNRHPIDDETTHHLSHGRDGNLFKCPLCGFSCDADVNAARVILARGRSIWLAAKADHQSPTPTDRRCQPVEPSLVKMAGSRKKDPNPSGLPKVA
jgi:putative transposase